MGLDEGWVYNSSDTGKGLHVNNASGTWVMMVAGLYLVLTSRSRHTRPERVAMPCVVLRACSVAVHAVRGGSAARRQTCSADGGSVDAPRWPRRTDTLPDAFDGSVDAAGRHRLPHPRRHC
jgi:hypothetical protein